MVALPVIPYLAPLNPIPQVETEDLHEAVIADHLRVDPPPFPPVRNKIHSHIRLDLVGRDALVELRLDCPVVFARGSNRVIERLG